MSATRHLASTIALAGLLAAVPLARPAFAGTPTDWPTFGWDLARTSAPTVSMGITPGNVQNLQRQQVQIDGTVDSTAIYLQGVTIKGAKHNAFFMTTTYGKTLAIDANSGALLWEFTPASYKQLEGTYRITNATPVADPDDQFIYAASPDGVIRKFAIADGKAVWRTAVTRLPEREKLPSPLAYDRGHIIVTTNGYVGDEPPYQGHVAILDARSGKLLHVWNSLCSDRAGLLDPASCPQSDSGIWGRAGAVIDAKTGDIFVATGNALWDGKTNWGDAVIELNSDATAMLGNWTPKNTEELNDTDGDLGSTSPVLTGGPYIIQGGKDRTLHVVDWQKMAGAAPHRGGEASSVPTPGHQRLFTAPALWQHGGASWVFSADGDATAAYTLNGDRLQMRWHSDHAGTSPVVADGMVFVYDPKGGLYIYDAASGKQLAKLDCGSGHWNSPIVADGMIALPEGNANEHATSGVLDIWRLSRQ